LPDKRAPPDKHPAPSYWLVKSEPESFGWDQQAARRVEPWTGVRNHAARNNLAAMRRGDRAFFYHSNTGREVVGVVEVAREAYPDPTVAADDPKGDWICVDMRAVGPMPRAVTLAEMKADSLLDGFLLLRQSRLSVVPVSDAHWRHVCGLGKWTGKL